MCREDPRSVLYSFLQSIKNEAQLKSCLCVFCFILKGSRSDPMSLIYADGDQIQNIFLPVFFAAIFGELI